jgi:ribosome-associated protein
MNKTYKNSQLLIKMAADTIIQKKGVDVIAFDVRNLSSVTDYYLIATGLNPPHLKTLLNELLFDLKHSGVICYRRAGTPESGWIVADYIDMIVHLFNPDNRSYYALESLYKDFPKIIFNENNT